MAFQSYGFREDELAMLLRILVNLIQRDIEQAIKHQAKRLIEGSLVYLIHEDARRSLNEINSILKSLKDQVEQNPSLEVTVETSKPLSDFLAKRWERIKSGPAAYTVFPSSSTNIWCAKIADWVSDELHCSMLALIMPGLVAPVMNAARKQSARDFSRHVLNDNNDGYIDVFVCLKTAFEDDYNPQLKHTSLSGGKFKPLSLSEAYRVINYCNESRRVYHLIEKKKEMPCEIGCALNIIRAGVKYPFILSYQQEGNKRLLANLFKTKESLFEALIQYPREEWSAFLSNFDLNDLSRVLLQTDPSDSHFKEKLQAILREDKHYADETLMQEAMLATLIHLYSGWLSTIKNEVDKCLEELDISIIRELLMKKASQHDELTINSDANGELSSNDCMTSTPLTLTFYTNLQRAIPQRRELVFILKSNVTDAEMLIHALSLMTAKEDIYKNFLNLFSYEELSKIWLGKIPSHKQDFLSHFNYLLADNSLCSDDTEHNRKLSYALHNYYASWRVLQDDRTVRVPFIGWKLGCHKDNKLEACRFNEKFLMSRKSIDEYDKYMQSYMEKIATNNENGQTKRFDMSSLTDALSNGTMQTMTARMKQIMSPDFRPAIAALRQ
jgi:hypothetical protein